MLSLKNISFNVNDFSLKNISLEIQNSDYLVLVGPSGSGKTMLLDTLAGFRKPQEGKIIYNGTDITDLAPNKRNIAFLFQDLALFPHLTVNENIAYPLKNQKLSKKEISSRTQEILKFIGIEQLSNRKIQNLSGGEKQRVALARSLVRKSDLLLLDEPFSAIDTQVKQSLKSLIKRISETGVSIIHVTHNIEEAVSMAKHISVIDNGQIIQTGTVEELFLNPQNSFAADFFGHKNYFKFNGLKIIDSINYFSPAPGVNIQIPQIRDYELNITGFIIDSNSIIISESQIFSSARNNFNGKVINIYKTNNAYDIEIDIGINIWATVTLQSFRELKPEKNKELWISFKTSAVKVIS